MSVFNPSPPAGPDSTAVPEGSSRESRPLPGDAPQARVADVLAGSAAASPTTGPHAVIRFLQACYDAEYRATSVTNLLHSSVRHLQFIEGDEQLLSGVSQRVPVGRWDAAAAIKEARLYPREKSLLYCAFPIIARVPKGPHKRRALCAPLLLYPARLYDEPDGAFLEVDLARQQLNLSVLAELVAATTETDLDVETLLDRIPRPPWDQDKVRALMELLGTLIPPLDVLSLHWFPRIKDASFVRTVTRKAHAKRPICLAACAVGLFRNSLETRGVLFELDELSRTDRWSRPLATLLQATDDSPPPQSDQHRPLRAPAILSPAQQRVVASAAEAPLTLVIGPPGTGKSFTIAATAVEHLGRGESVLIACRKPQAVDVVAEKVRELLGPNHCTLRGGEAQHQRELKHTLSRMLEGIRTAPRPGEPAARERVRQLDKQLARLDVATTRLERSLARHLELEDQWGRRAAKSEDSSFVERLYHRGRLWWLQRRLDTRRTLWQRLLDYQLRLRETTNVTRRLLHSRVDARIEQSLQEHRQHLTTFLRSLRTMSSMRQRDLFAELNPRLLFNAFPIWLSNIADISELVPLQRELFDVVIFDEATQCDIASCLPILQRARRAVVVGDPHQLRHLSFLGNERIQQIADEHQLDDDQRRTFHYRRRSFLDVVNDRITSQAHVHFLREHFRSLPQIIAFSNREFYAGALAVMRQGPRTADVPCVFPRWVAEGRKIGGANPVEGEALIQELLRQIESRAALPQAVCQTIGVVSPFRAQVDWLAGQLQQRLPAAAFQRHRLQVGTAHAFQGDERDLMFVSLVVDPDVHNASLRFVDKPHLFNVAITRARHQQYVFHSVRPGDLPTDSLTRRYLEFLDQRPPAPTPGPRLLLDTFLREVATALDRHGFRTWPDYELAGLPIDLVAEKYDRTIGIDLLGWPGAHETSFDLERCRMLLRAGLVLFPLPYSRWRQNSAACLAAIEQLVSAD